MSLFCAHCGTALKLDAKFCEECGAQIGRHVPASASRIKRKFLLISLLFTVLLGGGTYFLLMINLSGIRKQETFSTDNPYFRRGLEWMGIKRYDEARREFLQAIVQEPKNVEARYQTALSYRLQGQLGSAIEWCAETISVDPSYKKTSELVKEISTLTENLLSSSDDQQCITGLEFLSELLDRRLISSELIVREKVIPLGSTPSQ